MAFLYKRKDSQFWWIRYQSQDGPKRQPTRFRHDLTADTRRAREFRAQKELEELSLAAAVPNHRWAHWVVSFLETRYAHSPATVSRAVGIWKTLSVYLDSLKLTSPEEVRRDHCLGYVAWRKRSGHMNAQLKQGRTVAHNTVMLELRILNVILTEAVHRGWIDHSPCWRLGLRKEPAKKALELTPEHRRIIRAEIRVRLRSALASRDREQFELANFYRRSWQIADYQGIRLAETHLPISAFDLANGLFHRVVKGRRTVSTELSPRTAQLIRRLIRLGQHETYVRPGNPSLRWFKFFEHLRERHPQMKLVSHRSLRVSVISRLLRAGVPTDVVGNLVGHRNIASTAEYRRIKRGELSQVWQALNGPADGADKPSPPGNPGSPGSNPAPAAAPSAGRD